MSDSQIQKIKQSLLSAPDIIGKHKYFNSAVLIPLITIEGELHVLFQKRAEGIRQAGEISFPGGQFNPLTDKSFEDSALRETCEELGLETAQIELLGKLGTVVAPMGLTIDAFAGILKIDSLSEISINNLEVERVFTIPLSYFINTEPEIFYSRLEIHSTDFDKDGNKIELLPVEKLGLPYFYSKPWRNGNYRVLVYHTKPDIIWGLTAEIIYEFSRLIKTYDD